MLKHLIPLTALAMVLAACETATPVAGPAVSPSSPGAPVAPTGPVTIANMAATSSWVSDERLLPQLPILALVGASGRINDLAGFSITCNPDDGKNTARLGKQPANRAGQTATYRLRVGSDARQIEGKFEAKGSESEFVFPIPSNSLRDLARADVATIVTDTSETTWAFVKDPAIPSTARYVGSLKNFPTESEAYLVYCNPK